MDTFSFVIHTKTENVYEDIANDVEKRFDTSKYEGNRPLTTDDWINERLIKRKNDDRICCS